MSRGHSGAGNGATLAREWLLPVTAMASMLVVLGAMAEPPRSAGASLSAAASPHAPPDASGTVGAAGRSGGATSAAPAR